MVSLIFDTETTGLPLSFNVSACPLTLDNWNKCRMVQIAWRIYNTKNELIVSKCHIVKPDGFYIPILSTAIHKITTEAALEVGLPISKILTELFTDIDAHDVDQVVAHNIKFDDNVILSEIYRAKDDYLISIWKSLKKHCTMISNKSLFGGRWPKLHVLYEKVVGPVENVNKLHDAAEDCRLCAEIYIAQDQ